MLGALKRLKGRSFAEFRTRIGQRINVLSERAGFSPHVRLLSDIQLLGKFGFSGADSSVEKLLNHFRSRPSVQFLNSLGDCGSTVAALRTRFPEEEDTVVRRSDQICRGRFDLLGYKNLFFETEIPNWHYDPVSQQASAKLHWSKSTFSPASNGCDYKVIWELNRHQYFTMLGRAYLLTKEEKYAETFVAHLTNWCRENPPKIGINWASSLEIAFRSISWIWAFCFFKDSPKFTPDVLAIFLKVLYLNGKHLEKYLSTYSSPNTHLTGEALGLYFLATFMPELDEAGKWKDEAYNILISALDFQVREDGVYCEQSNHYHRYTTDFYAILFLLRRAEGLDVDPKHRSKLLQLLEFLLYVTQPNGETPLVGDDDGGRLHFFDEKPLADFRSTLALGAALFERGEFKFVSGAASVSLVWLLGAPGLHKFDELVATQPARTSTAFATSGFFVMRNSWLRDANYLLIDCGPHGFMNGGHAHADALGFVLSFDGRPIFVDSGTYKYASDTSARDSFRTTSAHNCLTVNGQPSAIPGNTWNWRSVPKTRLEEWDLENGRVRLRGTHDGFNRIGVIYQREIMMHGPDDVVVHDVVTSSNSNCYELNFIMSPDLEAQTQKEVVVVLDRITRQRLLAVSTTLDKVDESDAGWRVEKCYVSPGYGAVVESNKLIFYFKAKGTATVTNRFHRV